MARKYPEKEGLIGLEEAADYLGCSHQALSKILKEEPDDPLYQHFRFYAGRFRTTYALLDEFFTNGDVRFSRQSDQEVPNNGNQNTDAE